MILKVFIFLFISIYSCNCAVDQAIVFKSVDRTIDISNQLTKINYKLAVENTGSSNVDSFDFILEPGTKNAISYFSVESGDNLKTDLKSVEKNISGSEENLGKLENSPSWKIQLKDILKPKGTVLIEITAVLTGVLQPFPKEIAQKDKQLVQYFGNHYVYSLYKVITQKTVLQLGTKKVESFSKLNPTSQIDTTIVYGPYKNIAPLTIDKLNVHYENNSPFLVVTNLVRTIEVSHWGNIAVEEKVELHHVGAKLKGSFSRYEYQREAQSGLSSVKSFKTILPAAASDVYYRDEIGNISTSHYRELSDSVEVDLRPRFPLFGGWKTVYLLGYNIPSYEYLFSSGSKHALKIRFIDHIFDDMVINNAKVNIILPEYSTDIQLHPPFSVNTAPNGLHFTYLDTKGRPVLSISKNNLVEYHIQDIEIEYNFNSIYMFIEPALVSIALLILFMIVMVYVRLDFKLNKNEVKDKKQQ